MENPFKKMFQRKPEKVKVENEEGADTLYPGLSATSKRLFGLKEFRKVSSEELHELLTTDNRLSAYSRMDTTTLPRSHKIEYKKGVVREILSKNLIEEDTLKNNPTLYLGSGTDVEYPLALGARTIWLIDPIFESKEAREEVKRRIEQTIKNALSNEIQDLIEFNFDFGNGQEGVKVHLVAKAYGIENIDFPEKIGLVIMFASQGSGGRVELGSDIEQKIVDNGYILEESHLTKIQNKEKTTQQL